MTASVVDGTVGLSGHVLGALTDRGRPPPSYERAVQHGDLIRRTALLDWFTAHRTAAVVDIVAPAGYRNTTLISQAAEADKRPFACVAHQDYDNDPVVLMTHVAEGLGRIVGVGPAALERLRFRTSAQWSTIFPRLGAAFASIKRRSVIVLDDVHLLHRRDCLDVVAVCAYVPDGSQLLLTGRAEPQLGVARVRAERRLAELGRDELALDAIEAAALLSTTGVDLPGLDVAELTRRTEGWAAGLHLSALSLRERRSVDREAVPSVSAQDGHVADYLRSEVLSRLTAEEVKFLTRTAVLEWMCGQVCDPVLEQTGSAAMFESLRRSNLLVVSLDSRAESYRYHHAFRGLLLRELDHREPGAIPTLNPRAAARWSCTRMAAGAQGRPRVGPRRTQNSRPTGRVVRSWSHGSRCSLFRRRNSATIPSGPFRPRGVCPVCRAGSAARRGRGRSR
jgi:LuxR family transcriptional regulator, maltose regulon positive regulatory protein